jgi:hypothetical protein
MFDVRDQSNVDQGNVERHTYCRHGRRCADRAWRVGFARMPGSVLGVVQVDYHLVAFDANAVGNTGI